MGSLQNGLFGGFNGRVGNLVGYELNGKNVIRTIGHSTRPLSPARKINCDRMTIVNKFLRPISSFIKVGFRLKVVGTDRNFYNEAVSYNKKHAVTGVYPDAELDYPKAMLSMGTLLKAEKPSIQFVEGAIEFSWEVPADLPWKNQKDRAMVLLYWPDQNQHTRILSGSHRKDGKQMVQIDGNLANERVEAYISFINDDATEISDSVHAGSIAKQTQKTVPPVAKSASTEKVAKTDKKELNTDKKHFKSKINPVINTKTIARIKLNSYVNIKNKPDIPTGFKPKKTNPDYLE
ncbi:DUF6266 family protein [Pedobacter gandavensis]|uniref:DUF6266 family protein n=1 Tax=Pedobacter gandavensis TaxID=2679963 RepID=UPI0029303B5A|nr:DUF6266 family protein [Pedobacter gandavensis]